MVKAIKLSGIVIVLTLLLITLTACNGTPTPASTHSFKPASVSLDVPLSAVLLHDIDLASDSDAITVHITGGTIALDNDGRSIGEIGIATTYSYPAPDDYRHILYAFDFSPAGATFSPGIQVTLKYDPAAIPSDIRESQLVIAFYDLVSGEWQYINGAVNLYSHTITFTANHFTTFTIQTPPVIPPAPEPIETWVIVVPVVAAVLIILCISLFLYSRYKKHSHQVSDEDLYPPEDEDEEF